jgi:hypothetical protein
MREHRNLRLVSVLTITAALTFSVFASSALAALPNVQTGGGLVATCDPAVERVSGAEPTAVSPGGIAAFRIWAKNCDTSSIQAFMLTASTTPNASVYDPPGDAIGVIPSTGTCAPGPAVNCSFGAFLPGQEIHVLVAFVAPQNGQTLNVDFQWKTTGQGPDPKKRSHGDTAHWLDSVAINSSANYAGTFAFDSSLLSVSDTSTNLNNSNKQSTAIDAAALASELGTGYTGGIPLTVQDGPGIVEGCVNDPDATPAIVCSDLVFFGETSVVNVNDGFEFANYFLITVTIYKGPNTNQVHGVYHNWLDTDGNFQQELIETQFPAGGTPNTFPSFSVEKVGQNTVLVIASHHNGPYRGY